MLGNFGAGEMVVVLVIWLIPFAITIWLLRTVDRIRRGVERIAEAVEQVAETRTRAP
jgi:hypothetical protein